MTAAGDELRAEFTVDVLRQIMLAALADHNPQAAVAALEMMVRLHPVEGIAVYDEVQEALVLAKFLGGS